MILKSIVTKLLTLAFVSIFLVGCCTCCPKKGRGGFDNLCDLQKLSYAKGCEGAEGDCTANGLRFQALMETALTVGAQAGLAHRAHEIDCILSRNSKDLDRAFNFSLMMLPHNILPPVLVEGHETLSLDDCQTIRIADREYKIVKQACFVTTPPNWRDYIWLTFKEPDRPLGSLLPKTCDERKVWRCYTAIGWRQGIDQANAIYEANLARLKRDFTGMVRYRELLMQHMVSPPIMARTELGVTGTCEDMRINDQVLRITAQPCLETNSCKWRPVEEDP